MKIIGSGEIFHRSSSCLEVMAVPSGATQLLNPNLRIIDASWYLPDLNRFPLEEYKERHIPGASFFDLDEFSDADSNVPHMALDPESFSKKIEVFGINPNCIVVGYDG